MLTTIIVGLQWGDEGKGKIVDFIAGDFDIVVRFSGGMNASHTISVGEKKFRFSSIPSGSLRKNTIGVIADGVAINPDLLVEEIKKLKEDYSFDPQRLNIGQNAIVTFPYHISLDRTVRNLCGEPPTGTTGMGHGPTRTDQSARQGVRIFEYLSPDFMNKHVFNRTNKGLTPAYLFTGKKNSFFLSKDTYSENCKILKPLVTDTSLLLNNAIDMGKRVLFEGAQGTLLDMLYGFYPHVTSASTLAGGVCTGTGVGPTKIDRVLGVVKAYSTRVDLGPMISEITGSEGELLRELGNEYVHGATKPMRVGWLDLVALRYSIRLNSISAFALTKLDVLQTFDEIKICIAYRKKDKEYLELPVDVIGEEYHPVYKTFKGWKSDITNAEGIKDLPVKALDYIKFIEKAIQTPAEIISVGPRRSQTFFVCD